MREFFKRLSHGKLEPIFSFLYRSGIAGVYIVLRVKWFFSRIKKPTQQEIELMKDNVTIIFKSFERQKMAKRLFKNIQSYYPGIKVVIADDSSNALELVDENLEIIQLPFNSGLSFGLNKALEKVKTPYVIRMDDDELITPFTNWHGQLQFLLTHPEVDLVGVLPYNIPILESLEKILGVYYANSMSDAPKPLLIPHMTPIDEKHVVVGKSPNIFIANTEKLRTIGYDNNIRMIDHNDFFYRAAGKLVSVLDKKAFVLHYHNRFDRKYQQYREDVAKDRAYIMWKKRMESNNIGIK